MLSIPQKNLCESLNFFSKQQEETTGFYHEPFVDELDSSVDRIKEMSGTYLGYQVGAILLMLNKTPRYHFCFYDRFMKDLKIYDYMSNFMPWNRAPMGAGNMVDHGVTMMRLNVKMGYIEYKTVIEQMYKWLEKHQDPQTGLWGNIQAQGFNGLVQAGYHLMRGTYFYDKKPVNYIEKIIDTTIQSVMTSSVLIEGCGEGCHDMDHFVLLEQGNRITNGYREKDIKSIALRRLEQLIVMEKNDGAFSFEPDNSVTNHNRYFVTPGYNESDLVGTVFYLETILRLNKILGKTVEWKSSATHGVKE